MKYILLIGLLFGFNFTFWGLIGLLRLGWESISKLVYKNHNGNQQTKYSAKDVCAIVPAFNEEHGVKKTINSLQQILPLKQIYVIDDGSRDNTKRIIADTGCQFVSIKNRGKAGALATVIKHFRLTDEYEFLVLVDADSVIDKNYLKNALPFFNDPKVAAVAAYATTQWVDNNRLIAHRQKIYRLIQTVFRFGMAWKPFNVISIIPGFCSIYRASVVKKIKIDIPGLVIEDYNMTFEVQHQKLGKIVHHPKVFGRTQDPHTLKIYINQIKRWNLGLWQTIFRHGFWPSKFWLALIVYLFEVVTSSIFLIISPLLLVISVLSLIVAQMFGWDGGLIVMAKWYIVAFVVAYVVDYCLTILVAILEKKFKIAWYELRAFWLRYIDAWSILRTIPLALTEKSTGSWDTPRE